MGKIKGENMKREEAIEVLENEIKANCKVCMHPQEVGYCKNFCTYREAMEIAISALSVIDIVDLTKDNTITVTEYDGEQTEPSDLISRADVLKLLEDMEEKEVKDWSGAICEHNMTLNKVYFSVEDLPSVSAVSREEYDALCTKLIEAEQRADYYDVDGDDIASGCVSAEPTDLISRADAIVQITKQKDATPLGRGEYFRGIRAGLDMAFAFIRDLSGVSAERRGTNLEEEYQSLFTCSECGASCSDTIPWDCEINYCPNCGARMGVK